MVSIRLEHPAPFFNSGRSVLLGQVQLQAELSNGCANRFWRGAWPSRYYSDVYTCFRREYPPPPCGTNGSSGNKCSRQNDDCDTILNDGPVMGSDRCVRSCVNFGECCWLCQFLRFERCPADIWVGPCDRNNCCTLSKWLLSIWLVVFHSGHVTDKSFGRFGTEQRKQTEQAADCPKSDQFLEGTTSLVTKQQKPQKQECQQPCQHSEYFCAHPPPISTSLEIRLRSRPTAPGEASRRQRRRHFPIGQSESGTCEGA